MLCAPSTPGAANSGPSFGKVPDEFGQDPHVEPPRGLPPFEVELPEQTDLHTAPHTVPTLGQPLGDRAADARWTRLSIAAPTICSARMPEASSASSAASVCTRAARTVAGVDDRRDASIERSHSGQTRARVHVLRAIVRAERFGDDIDIGKEVIDVRHQPAHDAEPRMVVRIDQPRHHDGARGVDDCAHRPT